MTGNWQPMLDSVDHRVLPPDPDVLSAIGLGHATTSAIADLVDNCIDARAAQVLIRFVQHEGRLSSLLIFDDGAGMDDETIDRAMTVGVRRDYDASALGHFGIGLKAASFSQADALTVLSLSEGGRPVGRRWTRDAAQGFACDVIDPDQARSALISHLPIRQNLHGTIVRWDRVRVFPAARDPKVTDAYLTRTIQEIRSHLGLVFHRLLDRTSMRIDVLDASSGESGAAQDVEAIDPFGYRRAGWVGYPKGLTLKIGDRAVPLVYHVWPARSEALGFRLGGAPDRFQGFFFYRNGRLLDAGDWKGAAVPHKRLQLARIAVDISTAPDLFTMNMEKSSVQPRSEFVRALEHAVTDDGTIFRTFLSHAEEAYRLGNQRNSARKEVMPPGAGVPPEVKRALAHELRFRDGREPLAIRWRHLSGEEFFEVDRPGQTLWLNVKYRQALLGGRRGSLNDLPVLKALLYLLTEDVFGGTAYGPRDKDNVEIWQAVLTAAAQVESHDE